MHCLDSTNKINVSEGYTYTRSKSGCISTESLGSISQARDVCSSQSTCIGVMDTGLVVYVCTAIKTWTYYGSIYKKTPNYGSLNL